MAPHTPLPPTTGFDEAERWVPTSNARKVVDEAVSSARLLGGVFIALGALLLLQVAGGRMRGGGQVLAVANVVLLVGPGVWYFVAAGLVRRLDRRAATVALRVAAAQGAAVAAGFAVAALLGPNHRPPVAMAVMFAVFFMPALAALAYSLWRAREAMNFLGGGRAGFEALAPRPVIPVDAMIEGVEPDEASRDPL